MLKFGILGLGQAGSNLAEYAITKGFKAVAVNTAKVDLNLLKYIPTDSRLYLEGYNGAGRNRIIGKDAIISNADKICKICNEKLDDCDTIFVAASGGGGTGSGAFPIAIEILLEMYSFVNIIYILPDNLESPSAKINAYDCFSEISENQQIGSIFIIDNQKGKDLNVNVPKFKIHNIVNKQIIDNITEINELTDKTSYTNNFDERDLLDILGTRGCTLLSKTTFNNNKTLKDNDISANIQLSWNEMYSPTYNTGNVIKAAILGKVKNMFSNKINIQQIFNGNTPYDIKDSLYSAKDDQMTFYTIFSGLEFPNERLENMKKDIEKVQENLIKRLETSQNQKLSSMDWKLNVSRIESPIHKDDKQSLSDRLKKFK